MKTLNRLLLVALSAALMISAYGLHAGLSSGVGGHNTFYLIKQPWLHEVRQPALFGVLIWCLLFVKSEPMWVRLGLVAVLFSLAIMLLPPTILKHPLDLRGWH